MINFFDTLVKKTNNLDHVAKSIKILSKNTPVKKIFDSISEFSTDSEVRYVGGCLRKIIKNELVDDIDLATNLTPEQVCKVLTKNNIDYYKTGIEHGTITALIDTYKFEITSLREDVETDGRHAKIKFSTDWKKDASRRDLTINSIYSDIEGNLFDPYKGKEDLENGVIKFIGESEKRIQEDYLRILRYLRFFLAYSNHKHDDQIIKAIKKNLNGISSLSNERLLDELKKFIKSNVLSKLSRDKFSIELFEIIFPQIKNIKFLRNLNIFAAGKLKESDFILLLSILIIDGSDNADYFIYKFNLSKKDQKRIKTINNFYNKKITVSSFSEKNLNKFFYFNGKEAVIDILSYRLFFLRKVDKNLLNSMSLFKSKILPVLPIGAKILMEKYKIPEGITLGTTLKKIEEEWVNSNFQLTEKQINKIIDC